MRRVPIRRRGIVVATVATAAVALAGIPYATIPNLRAAIRDHADLTPPSGTVVASLSTDQGSVAWLDVGPLGGELRRLTPQPPLEARMRDTRPSWSPDGSQIAFIREAADGFAFYTVGRDGSNLRQIAQLPLSGAGTSVTWSANGPSLVFDRFSEVECRRKKRFRLRFTIASPDGTLRDVDALPRPRKRVALLDAWWLPDGKGISYIVGEWPSSGMNACRGHAGYYDSLLYEIRADGTGRKLLARAFLFISAAWSSDSRRLAYGFWGPDADCDIAVVAANGTGKRTLRHDGPCDADVAWTSDGSAVAVEDSDKLDLIDLASRRARTLVRWTRFDNPGRILGLSPDGQWLAVVEDSGSDDSYRTTFVRVALVPLAGGRPATYTVRREAPDQSLDDFSLTFR